MSGEVNVPLLRKAVEWAEAEAAKPPEVCEWDQRVFRLDESTPESRRQRLLFGKAPECGTCYCIAGYVHALLEGGESDDEADFAADALGISDWYKADGDHLFDSGNSIEDVRRIAEELAGERL